MNNLDEVRNKFLILDTELVNYLTLCEQRLTDAIMDFCNIDKIPDRLNSLIQQFLTDQYELNKDGVGEGKTIVTSATDNGQSVGLKNVGGVESLSKDVAEFISRNEDSLLPYRKMRW